LFLSAKVPVFKHVVGIEGVKVPVLKHFVGIEGVKVPVLKHLVGIEGVKVPVLESDDITSDKSLKTCFNVCQLEFVYHHL
jgi:type IV secretory pathway protease TraF